MLVTPHIIENTNYQIVDFSGYRYLSVQDNLDGAMSVMKLDAPNKLVAPYAMSMLWPLAFKPDPHDIVLLGLGGGMQAKFVHQHMPLTRTVALEIDPDVVDIAHTWFGLPNDDERLSVVVGDAGGYIAQHPDSCDILLTDAYDESFSMSGTAAGLAFYQNCHRALRDDGIMALNLFRQNDEQRKEIIRTLKGLFSDVVAIPIDHVQSVLLVFKEAPSISADKLIAHSSALENKLGIGLAKFSRWYLQSRQNLSAGETVTFDWTEIELH